MKKRIFLGNCPTDENDIFDTKKQCEIFLRQMQRQWTIDLEKENTFFIQTGQSFLTYQVCIEYDTNNNQSKDIAFDIEKDLPKLWDNEARKELGLPKLTLEELDALL